MPRSGISVPLRPDYPAVSVAHHSSAALTRRFPRDHLIAFGLEFGDLPQHQLVTGDQPLELRPRAGRDRRTSRSFKTIQARPPIDAAHIVAGDAKGRQQRADAVGEPNALGEQLLALAHRPATVLV